MNWSNVLGSVRPITKLLVANRGEIAVRVIRAARDLGISTVQVFSDADSDSLAVRLADESVHIGASPASSSYLNADAIISAALSSGADAVHPGYGFLAENADFADLVESSDLVFVGPSGDVIRLMGDKSSARSAASSAGVPTVPGSDGVLDDMDEALSLAERIGFPVMIKASAGGGGRGIRIVDDADTFVGLASQASSEASAAFGDGGIYIEKVISDARHIEVQILGDGSDCVHFFERECSLQRRRQKVWEEAPSVSLSPERRDELCSSAVSLARSVNYRGAGTIEYLYSDELDEFWFIEMNTRIQVEHPVTEMITGFDLVGAMIEIAGGGSLPVSQSDIRCSGHAIEVRINAEDSYSNFMPCPGTIESLAVPGGLGVRFDHMLYAGYEVPPFYDSLLGKLIVWSSTRESTLLRLERALGEIDISGISTTVPLHLALTGSDAVRLNDVHTNWLESWLMSEEFLSGKVKQLEKV